MICEILPSQTRVDVRRGGLTPLIRLDHARFATRDSPIRAGTALRVFPAVIDYAVTASGGAMPQKIS